MERSPLSLDVNRPPKGATTKSKEGISQHTAAEVVHEYLRRVYDDVGNVVERTSTPDCCLSLRFLARASQFGL